MGNRLTKIVTKTGDNGTTGLGDGSRIPKSNVRMDAIGDVDELNCVIGLVLVEMHDRLGDLFNPISSRGYDLLKSIQHFLFDLGGELSIPGHTIIHNDDVDHLGKYTEEWNAELPYLTNFILPGGSELISRLHIARAVTRRAERSVIKLSEIDNVNPASIHFLNRLSDLLFVLARVHSYGKEVLWRPKEKSDD